MNPKRKKVMIMNKKITSALIGMFFISLCAGPVLASSDKSTVENIQGSTEVADAQQKADMHKATLEQIKAEKKAAEEKGEGEQKGSH